MGSHAAPAPRVAPAAAAAGGRCRPALPAARPRPCAMADVEDGEEAGAPHSHPGSAGSKAGGPDKMFSLKKWNAVAMWSWDVECDTCAICRVQVMGKRRTRQAPAAMAAAAGRRAALPAALPSPPRALRAEEREAVSGRRGALPPPRLLFLLLRKRGGPCGPRHPECRPCPRLSSGARAARPPAGGGRAGQRPSPGGPSRCSGPEAGGRRRPPRRRLFRGARLVPAGKLRQRRGTAGLAKVCGAAVCGLFLKKQL